MSQILYFVGAGLSKALAQSTHPVPGMVDFVSTCAEYISDDVILTTLTELERCEPYPYLWDSPSTVVLADRMLQQRRQNASIDPIVRQEFARALRNRPAESIEDLLDRTGRNNCNRSSLDADERFRFAIRRVFTLIGWNVDWCPLTSFLRRQFALADSSHTFVSFNYDLVLERGIQLVDEGKVNLAGMYGFTITWQAHGDPPFTNGRRGGVPVVSLDAEGIGTHPYVLKPHGSLNWLVPIEGHYDPSRSDELRQGKSVILAVGDNGAFHYPAYYPTPSGELYGCHEVQLPHELSGGVIGATMATEPVILAPRGRKKPERQFLRDVREREEAAVREADEVYILGWSIPRTDTDQEYAIRHVVGKRAKPFQQVTAVNFHADVEYYSRVQDIFQAGRNIMRVQNAGFREFAATG